MYVSTSFPQLRGHSDHRVRNIKELNRKRYRIYNCLEWRRWSLCFAASTMKQRYGLLTQNVPLWKKFVGNNGTAIKNFITYHTTFHFRRCSTLFIGMLLLSNRSKKIYNSIYRFLKTRRLWTHSRSIYLETYYVYFYSNKSFEPFLWSLKIIFRSVRCVDTVTSH